MFSFLYKYLFKPLAFAQDPERVHDMITFFGKILGRSGIARSMTHRMFAFEHPDLMREVAEIKFKNPIGLAAGFDKNAHLMDILPYVGFGFAEFGSITAKPCEGNPKPRLWRLPESQALVVNYGLMNDGVDVVLERMRKSRVVRLRLQSKFPSQKLASQQNVENAFAHWDKGVPDVRKGSLEQFEDGNLSAPAPTHESGQEEKILKDFRIGISIAKTNCKETAGDEDGIQDYYECFTKVNASRFADYITINVSCPNAYGGEPFTTPDKFERLSAKLKEDSWKVPVFVKLPNDYSFEELDGMLEVAVKYRYAGVIVSNLTKDRINNPVLQKSDLSKVGKGGISGKPTFERSNRLITRVRERYPKEQLAIIGCGGVFSGEDAKVKLDAGADLIQMITGMIYEGPQVVGEINKYLIARST